MISWDIMHNIFSRIAVLETERKPADGDWVIVHGEVYRVSSVSEKDYEVYVYKVSDGEFVHGELS